MKLYVLIGIAGAGKSTYAKDVLLPVAGNDAALVSSDAIRAEIFGDENSQDNNALVFKTAYERVREYLKSGRNVIFDATNMSQKDRKQIRNCIAGIRNLAVQAHVILATPEQALKNQDGRSRKVPFEILVRQMLKFGYPDEDFWTEDPIFYHAFSHDLNTSVEALATVKQTSKYHLENALTHTRMVVDYTRETDGMEDLCEVARYHDIGKLYAYTTDDTGTHFYQHANGSTWLYLCGRVSGSMQLAKDRSIGYTARMIQYHDSGFNGFSSKQLTRFGEQMIDDLTRFHKCDVAGSIRKDDIADMSLLAFMNRYRYWDEILQEPTLDLHIRKDGNYVLLKYAQFSSDMSFRLVREARGPVFKEYTNAESGFRSYHYVCRPFDKFFNYGEQYAAEIDWASACALEKIDGSLMKLFYDDGFWHLATNGTIDAFEASVGDTGLTFGDLFERALGGSVTDLGHFLNKEYTYLFELTSPESRVVIPYKDGVYYLSMRHNLTGKESDERPLFGRFYSVIREPLKYRAASLESVLNVVARMGKDEEGFVVKDKVFHRIKIKSQEYLNAAYAMCNHNLSQKRIFEILRNETVDDLLAYAPEYQDRVNDLRDRISGFATRCDNAWKQYGHITDRKEFAEAVIQHPLRAYLFKKVDDTSLTPQEYLFSKYTSVTTALKLLDIRT